MKSEEGTGSERCATMLLTLDAHLRVSSGDSGSGPDLTQDSSFDRLPVIHLFKEAGRWGRIDLSCQLLEKHQGLSGKKWREINSITLDSFLLFFAQREW